MYIHHFHRFLFIYPVSGCFYIPVVHSYFISADHITCIFVTFFLKDFYLVHANLNWRKCTVPYVKQECFISFLLYENSVKKPSGENKVIRTDLL